jgi:hypothetical protein
LGTSKELSTGIVSLIGGVDEVAKGSMRRGGDEGGGGVDSGFDIVFSAISWRKSVVEVTSFDGKISKIGWHK